MEVANPCEHIAILQMYCIGYTDTLTMSIPLQILPLLAADFDGEWMK